MEAFGILPAHATRAHRQDRLDLAIAVSVGVAGLVARPDGTVDFIRLPVYLRLPCQLRNEVVRYPAVRRDPLIGLVSGDGCARLGAIDTVDRALVVAEVGKRFLGRAHFGVCRLSRTGSVGRGG